MSHFFSSQEILEPVVVTIVTLKKYVDFFNENFQIQNKISDIHTRLLLYYRMYDVLDRTKLVQFLICIL